MNIGDSGGCKIKIQCITVPGSGVRRFIFILSNTSQVPVHMYCIGVYRTVHTPYLRTTSLAPPN